MHLQHHCQSIQGKPESILHIADHTTTSCNRDISIVVASVCVMNLYVPCTSNTIDFSTECWNGKWSLSFVCTYTWVIGTSVTTCITSPWVWTFADHFVLACSILTVAFYHLINKLEEFIEHVHTPCTEHLCYVNIYLVQTEPGDHMHAHCKK